MHVASKEEGLAAPGGGGEDLPQASPLVIELRRGERQRLHVSEQAVERITRENQLIPVAKRGNRGEHTALVSRHEGGMGTSVERLPEVDPAVGEVRNAVTNAADQDCHVGYSSSASHGVSSYGASFPDVHHGSSRRPRWIAWRFRTRRAAPLSVGTKFPIIGGMFRDMNLQHLNSATKYPSIPTYHAIGKKGRLTDEVQVDFAGERVFVSEKVDGTNSRLIRTPDGAFIAGSRNELIWHSEDLLYNPVQSIVDVLKSHGATDLPIPADGLIRVYFGESYGGKITAQSKQYSKTGTTGFRLFDVLEFDSDRLAEVLSWDGGAISGWREAGGQPFLATSALEAIEAPLTPRLEVAGEVPTGHADVLDWLSELLPATRCALDDSALGEPEGVIVRNEDRTRIAKIRYQDYRRTLGRGR